MQDGAVVDIDRELAPFFDDAAMRDIAASRELARQVNDIANMDVLEIFALIGVVSTFLAIRNPPPNANRSCS